MKLLIISYIAFISLGLPDGLLGVAWPGIRQTFGLELDTLGLILIFFTAGYMFSSFFSGVFVRRFGIGVVLALSCGVTSLAMFVFAFTSYWWIFILFAAVGGLGGGAIDAGINTFVAKNHSTRMMQWLHASFGVGVTIGPIIMTLGISLTSRWQVGYIVVSLFQAFLAILFVYNKELWEKISFKSKSENDIKNEASLVETIRRLPAILSMLMFFIYTGIEVGIGLWAYSILTESRGVSPQIAGFVTGSYWAMFTVGRIIAGLYSKNIEVKKLIYFSLFLAFVGVGFIIMNLGIKSSVLGFVLAGFAVAPIFPGLVSDTKKRVGLSHQANTIGMQTSAAGFGGAIIPSIAGIIAKYYGLEAIPIFIFSAIFFLLVIFVFSHFFANLKHN